MLQGDDALARRTALFGDGTQAGGLIANVLIGDNNRNPYDNLHKVLSALSIGAQPAGIHQNHFHIALRTCNRVPLAQNFLVDNAALDQTQSSVSEELRTAAQALVEQVQPHLDFEQGDLTMFAMDMPDVPPQYAPIVIAQAKQATRSTDRIIGVCHLIENPPIPAGSAVNATAPVTAVWGYKKQERVTPEQLTADMHKAAKVTLLQRPEHGTSDDEGGGYYGYQPTSNYYGPDRAAVLVEMGGFKVKVRYFFKVMSRVPGGTERYDPYQDKKNCPQGEIWRISRNPNDPSTGEFTFNYPSQWTGNFPGFADINLKIADLSGSAVGQTTGNTIALDTDAAGYGWFIDSTPFDNSEFLPTSNPNERREIQLHRWRSPLPVSALRRHCRAAGPPG